MKIYDDGGWDFAFSNHEAEIYPRPALYGPHQYDNAATAIATAHIANEFHFKSIDKPIPPSAFQTGITNASWPARMQRLENTIFQKFHADLKVILDGGHNPPAGKAIAQSMAENAPYIMLVGMLKTKEASEFLAPFAPYCELMMVMEIPNQENSLSADEIGYDSQKGGDKISYNHQKH